MLRNAEVGKWGQSSPCKSVANLQFVCDLIPGPARNERIVWVWHLIWDFNGCFREIRCTASKGLLQVRKNAASVTRPNVNVGKVRTAVTQDERLK
jgi:hypothetical protein